MILVSVLILFAAVTFAAIVFSHSCCYPVTPRPITIVDSSNESSMNWSLTVTATLPGLKLDEIHLRIFNGSDYHAPFIRVTMSSLTEENWTIYGILYKKVSNETEVGVGASIVVSKTWYPEGFYHILTNDDRLLCNGDLGGSPP